jgi:phosphopantetheinyl transferase
MSMAALRVDWPREYRDIHFSISHTTGLVVIAVGRNSEIGIDVETPDREVEIEDIAKSVLTETEAYELVGRVVQFGSGATD